MRNGQRVRLNDKAFVPVRGKTGTVRGQPDEDHPFYTVWLDPHSEYARSDTYGARSWELDPL